MNFGGLFVIFAICIGLLLCSRIDFDSKQQTFHESVILGQIINNFLRKYFTDDRIFVSLLISPPEKELNHFQDDFNSHLVINLASAGFSYNILNKLGKTHRDDRIPFHLMVVDDSKNLQKILDEKAVQEFHMSQKFLVIVTGSAQGNVRTLDEAFQVLWTNGLVNSHVLIQNAINFWSLYTFLPYQIDCFALSHLKIESFMRFNFSTPMKLTIDQVYPQKLSDFSGCPLYIAPTIFAPFVTVLTSFDGNYHLGGVDINIINDISKALNFTIVYNVLFKIVNGAVVNNRTTSELLDLVVKGEMNLTFGGLLKTDERDRIASPSDTYFYIRMHFIYKNKDAYIPPISSLTAPLDAFVWHITFGILLLSVVIILMTKRLTRKWRHFYIGGRINRTPILNAWAIVLGRPIANPQIAHGRSIGNFARTLTFLWIMLWFFVRSQYEGTLYNFLQHYQPPSPYDTVEKVIASDCKIITNHGAYSIIKHLIKNNRYVEISLPNGLSGVSEHFYDSNIDGVALFWDNFVKLFNSINVPHRRLSTTKDPIFFSSNVMYFRKKSILKTIFNEKLHRFRESGLIELWISQYINDRKLHKSHSIIHIENIFGALQICAVMYLISFVVLFLEVISLIHPRIKFIIDYFTY